MVHSHIGSQSLTVRPYVKQKVAAEYLDVSVSRLETWRVTGGGPPFCKIGRGIRYSYKDLDEWVLAHRRHSTAEYSTRERTQRARASRLGTKGHEGAVIPPFRAGAAARAARRVAEVAPEKEAVRKGKGYTRTQRAILEPSEGKVSGSEGEACPAAPAALSPGAQRVTVPPAPLARL